jgi:hypothetical protein
MIKPILASEHRFQIVAGQMKAGFSNLVGLLDLNSKTGVKSRSSNVDVEDRPFDDFKKVNGKDNQVIQLKPNSSMSKFDNNIRE